jgi:hypothetical protein
MKTLLALLIASLPAAALGNPSKALCKTNEKVAFSCSTNGGKRISVCVHGEAVQYRFGRPGKVELEYPKDGAFKSSSFQYFHYFRPNVDRTSLSFETTEAEYTVSSESEGSEHSADLFVKVKSTGRILSMKCVGATEENWHQIEHKVECADEAMNACQYRTK